MADAELGRAALLILTVHDQLGRNGWYALLSVWHAALLTHVAGSDPDDPQLPATGWADEPPEGTHATEAALRWRRWCTARDLDPVRTYHSLVALERLGLLRRRRFLLLFRRYAIAEPMPSAFEHPELDEETRAAAVESALHHRVGASLGGLLDAGDGHHEAPSLAALAASVAADEATVLAVFEDGGMGATLTIAPDGRAVVDEVPDPDRDELLDALDAVDVVDDARDGPG